MKIHHNKLNNYIFSIGLTTIGALVITANLVGRKNNNMNQTARESVRDSFTLSAKEFGNIEKRINKGSITWENALDSLKRVKK